MRLTPVPDDPAELCRVYRCFPSGITALCALGTDQWPAGMVASSFTSVSVTPPLVSVCVQNTSTTWPLLRTAPRLGVSVLAEGQGAATRQLAARDGDRFAGLDWSATGEGAVLLAGAAAWLSCSVDAEVPAGDHVIALLRVRSVSADQQRPPLVFHGSRFRTLAGLAPAG